MKKRIFVLILCMFSFLFCGCGVEPQYTIAQKSDGSVMQMIYLPFSGAELSYADVTYEQIAELSNQLKNTFNNYFLNMYSNFVTKVTLDSGLDENEKMTMLAGCPTQSDMLGRGQFNGISYEFNFASGIHYYYFNSNLYYNDLVARLKKDTSITEVGFFVSKKITTSTNFYGSTTQFDSDHTFAEYISNQCKLALEENTTLSDEQIDGLIPKTFIYRYGVSTKKIHSDADLVRLVDGMYYHEWNITLENPTREITTYNYIVNKNVWYALVLAVSLILLVILLTVAKVKENKNNTKSPKIIIEQPK